MDEAPVNEKASEEPMDTLLEEDEESLTHKAIHVLDRSDTLATTTSELSVVSSNYDLEGRGELNDAQQASKWLPIHKYSNILYHLTMLTHVPLSIFHMHININSA